MTAQETLVIGAGVNGLVTATLLAKRGHRVTVLERRDAIGGLCETKEFHPGFRANTCVDDPGWMPASLHRELGLAVHGYDPSWSSAGVIVAMDDEPVALMPAVAATTEALRRFAPDDAHRWQAFCARVASLSGMLAAVSEVRAPMVERLGAGDALPLLSLGRRLRGLGRRGMVDFLRAVPMPVSDWLEEQLSHPRLRAALATLGVRDVQHGPMSGGTTLVYLQQHLGVPDGTPGLRRVAKGGVGALPLALAAAARAAGVIVRTGAEVIAIKVAQDAVAGVVLSNGEELTASAVVSSADMTETFGRLVDPAVFDPEFLHGCEQVRTRGPAVRVHLALDALPQAFERLSQAARSGRVVLADSVEEVEQAYDAAKHGGIASRPVLDITIPSVADSSLAPAGRHVMSVHAQFAAHGVAGGWNAEARSRCLDGIRARLAAWAPDLPGKTVAEVMLTPADVHETFGASGGSVLHGELALDQFLFMRPVPACARYDTPLPGLWLCGSSTHPGAGTAGVSGWLAAKEISR